MATLYEIESAIMDCVDAETGEIINEEQLNALLMERNAKLEGVALWIKNLESDAAAIRAEREALEKRQKVAENKAASLRTVSCIRCDAGLGENRTHRHRTRQRSVLWQPQ